MMAYMIYINVLHPYISKMLMQSYYYLELKWLPNVAHYFSVPYNRAQVIAPGRFAEDGLNDFYFEEAGSFLTSWLAILILLFFAKWFLRCVVVHDSDKLIKFTYESPISRDFIRRIVKTLQWGFLLRAVIEMYFPFCIATFLGMNSLDFNKNDVVLFSASICAVVGTLFIIIFPFISFIIVNNINKKAMLDRDYEFHSLHSEFRRDSSLAPYFLSVRLIQKILIAMILV
jgi:hypothetical protein